MDFPLDRDRLFQLNPRRGVYMLTGGLAFLVTELGRNVYRPWVYGNGIQDWGIADTLGNSGGTMTIICLELGLINATRRQGMWLTAIVTAGLAIYELITPLLPKHVLDVKDVLATLATGIVACLYHLAVQRWVPEPGE